MPKYSTDDIIKQARKTFQTVEMGHSTGLEDFLLKKEHGKWSLRHGAHIEFVGESTEEVMKDIGLYRGSHLIIEVPE
jgi:hypothetical protein